VARNNCTTIDGLSDLQFLIIELEKSNPDPKTIKALTSKYGIPYKTSVSEQLGELLNHLNNLDVPIEIDPTTEA
jgi:hypothetical protein